MIILGVNDFFSLSLENCHSLLLSDTVGKLLSLVSVFGYGEGELL